MREGEVGSKPIIEAKVGEAVGEAEAAEREEE